MVNKISDEVRRKILQKSVQNLPDRPRSIEYPPQVLKKRFENTVFDDDEANLLAQLDRIVDEINAGNGESADTIEEIRTQIETITAQLGGTVKNVTVPFVLSDWTLTDDGKYRITVLQAAHGLQHPLAEKVYLCFTDETGNQYSEEIDFEARAYGITKAVSVFVEKDLSEETEFSGQIIIREGE